MPSGKLEEVNDLFVPENKRSLAVADAAILPTIHITKVTLLPTININKIKHAY